jgi:hypothetical protein
VKVQLVKGETKETFGTGENSFDYWYRPLTVEEKQNINAHIVWKTVKGVTNVDFSKTDPFELVRLAVTKIDRLYASDDSKIDTIDKLLSSTIDAGELDGIAVSMWVKIWMSINLSEELKKKLKEASIPGATG